MIRNGAIAAALAAFFGAAGEVAAQNPFTPEANAQREAARGLEPVALEPPVPATPRRSAAIAVKIRFYADGDYRAGLFRWADRAKAQLSQLNQFIEPAFGVRLEAESFRRWHREGGNGDVFKLLEELEKMDAGQGVDWVVAYVTPLPLVTSSIHQIGAARVMGRHFVLRGMASAEESQALGKAFDQLDPAEREQLYSRRKWHKECAIFLHEWLHTLGAIHSTDQQQITHPSYTNRMKTLAPIDAELAAEALQARIEARHGGAPNYAGLRAALARVSNPSWVTKERDELLAGLAKLPGSSGPPPVRRPPEGGGVGAGAGGGAVAGGKGPGPVTPGALGLPEGPGSGSLGRLGPRGGAVVGGEAPGGTLSSEDRAVMEKAIDQMKTGKPEGAWKLVEPLGERHRGSLDVQRLLCRLGHVPGKKKEGTAACERAKELAPSLPDPWIDCAHAQLMRKELPEALATADEAATRARNLKSKRDIWLWISRLYGQMGALTRAEETAELAAGSVPEAELAAARDTIARERRNLALPRPPAGEPRPEPATEMGYVAAFRNASRLLDARRIREGKLALEEARRHIPTAPGLDLLACEIDLRQNRPRQGEKSCQRALDAMTDLPRAHYLLGHAKLQSGARDAAAASLKRSIDLDPKEIGPWEALADIYRASGKRQELATLKAEYEKLFSRPLK